MKFATIALLAVAVEARHHHTAHHRAATDSQLRSTDRLHPFSARYAASTQTKQKDGGHGGQADGRAGRPRSSPTGRPGQVEWPSDCAHSQPARAPHGRAHPCPSAQRKTSPSPPPSERLSSLAAPPRAPPFPIHARHSLHSPTPHTSPASCGAPGCTKRTRRFAPQAATRH